MYLTQIDGFEIRKANQDDCGTILEFIHDLARYEKLTHECVATEPQLATYLFGEHRFAEVLLGEENGRPVGFALFFQTFSTFIGRPGIYLEDLFVSPDDRGKGFGKALLACLATIAVERDCGRLEWSVLDWNQPAIDFYQSLGAESMQGWSVNRVAGERLEDLARKFEIRS